MSQFISGCTCNQTAGPALCPVHRPEANPAVTSPPTMWAAPLIVGCVTESLSRRDRLALELYRQHIQDPQRAVAEADALLAALDVVQTPTPAVLCPAVTTTEYAHSGVVTNADAKPEPTREQLLACRDALAPIVQIAERMVSGNPIIPIEFLRAAETAFRAAGGCYDPR